MNSDNDKYGFLFDLDGVIIDSEKEYTRIWSTINKEYPSGYEDLAERIKGTTLFNILNKYYPDRNIQVKVEQRLHQLENQMDYNYLPGAQEFLKKLKSKKFPTALVTSSDNEKMSHLFAQHPELKEYFDIVITGNLVKNSKPSPEGYLLGAEKIMCNPKNCVVFEDSLQGVKAGKNAGALVVGVCGTLKPEFLAPYSYILINNFNEIDIDNLILTLRTNE